MVFGNEREEKLIFGLTLAENLGVCYYLGLKRPLYLPGEVAERLKAPVSKTGIPERVSRVRTPPSPPKFGTQNFSKNYGRCEAPTVVHYPISISYEHYA